ncbi:MAG: molybdopterin oxidoreductase, partial [Planctomycetaceae bacterium]|nr:molybdopterin oxidoreductase [Planctomycetaceae bacterium]
LIPGKPLYYATAMPGPDGAAGLIVRSDMGRPTKIEGNPRHPASLGATDPAAQAEIYTFWDPDRSSSIQHAGRPGTWPEFLIALQAALSEPRARRGEGLRILTEAVCSPTLAGQLDRLKKELPGARWHAYDSVGRDFVRAGSLLAFGVDVDPVYHLDQAEVVFSLDADLLCRPREARDFSARRRGVDASGTQNRLYCVEPMPTTTGAAADHRWPLRACEIPLAARDLALALEIPIGAAPAKPLFDWIPALARDLRRHAGRSLVVAGREQDPIVHACAALVNQALGNEGKTVTYIDAPVRRPGDGRESVAALTADMADGKVRVLFLLGGNPAFTAPVDLDFERALSKVPFSVHLGLYADETAWRSTWHLPESHFLESWGDARAFDGTASIIQPLIAPLYESRTAPELLSAVLGEPGRASYDLVREHWRQGRKPQDFEAFWQSSLHEGLVENSAFASRNVEPNLEAIRSVSAIVPKADAIEVVLRPDPTIGDGRHANNPWLQELPKPLTKLTWDNAAMLGPAAAARLGVTSGDMVELNLQGRLVQAPAWIVPGHADRSVTLHLGYGRKRAGRVGTGLGFDAGQLRTLRAYSGGLGLQVRKTGRRYALASTQLHHSMEGRDPVHTVALNALERSSEEREPRTSLYADVPVVEHAWGMVIDLNACTNCNSCVTACQVENNIPVVGKDQVLLGRELHWIRVDTYHEGPA